MGSPASSLPVHYGLVLSHSAVRLTDLHALISLAGQTDVVDLEDHADELRGQRDLLLLGQQSLDHVLRLHVVRALLQAVDAQARVVLFDLLTLDITQRDDGIEAGIFSQRHGNVIEGVGERAHGVLLQSGDLVSLLGDVQRACHLSGTTSIDNPVISNEIPDDADSIVERSFGLFDDHFVAATNEDCHRLRVFALFQDQHLVTGRTEAEFLDDSARAQFF